MKNLDKKSSYKEDKGILKTMLETSKSCLFTKVTYIQNETVKTEFKMWEEDEWKEIIDTSKVPYQS